MNAIMLMAVSGVYAAIGFVLLNVALAGWYRWHTRRGLLHLHVLLFKYPAFVLLLAGAEATASETLCAAAALYAALCLFELFDDADRLGPPGIAVALHALVLCSFAFGREVDVRGTMLAALVGLLVVIAVPNGPCARHCGAAVGYLPFVAVVLVFVRISLGGSA